LPVDWTTAQPYEQWRALRESGCPVVETAGSDFDRRTGYQITDYEHVERVLRDPETFSSSINAEHIGHFMGDLILALDGIEHRKYRNLVAKAFRASQLERWDDTLVRPTIGRLLDAIAPAGRGDLVTDVTLKYPVQVICGIVGVPLEDADQFAQWAEEIKPSLLVLARHGAHRIDRTELGSQAENLVRDRFHGRAPGDDPAGPGWMSQANAVHD